MAAYLHQNSKGYILTVCGRPCRGEEFQQGTRYPVFTIAEARKLCADLGAEPWNF